MFLRLVVIVFSILARMTEAVYAKKHHPQLRLIVKNKRIPSPRQKKNNDLSEK